jgi:hypothetical protein
MRWVERVDWLVPGRLGLRPVVAVRGMAMGWVVATPEGTAAGIKPVGCGGLTEGNLPVLGGVWIFGGVGCVFATEGGTSGGFLSFLPNEKNAIC